MSTRAPAPPLDPVGIAVTSALLLLLFSLQLAMLGGVPATAFYASASAIGSWAAAASFDLQLPQLLLAAVPAGLLAFGLARLLLRWSLVGREAGVKAWWLVGLWSAVCIGCYLAMYVLLGGHDIGTWSPALILQPSSWYAFAACAVGLALGARQEV